MSIGGLDVGTTVCRLIVFDERGKVLASSYREYPLIIDGGRLEISPGALWKAVCDVCRESSSEVRGDPIRAIGVSAMGDSLIPADRSLGHVGNAILAFDTRSKDACGELVSKIGFEKWYDVTGMPAHSMATATKIAWYLGKEGRQAAVKALPDAERFMCAEDFVIGRLTGSPVMSWSTAARTMLFDVVRKQWWDEILSLIGIDRRALSSVEPAGVAVGTVTTAVSEMCGLDPGTLVATAGHDQVCSAVGSGAVRDGIVSDNTGTFECVSAAIGERRRNDVDRRALARTNLGLYPHGPLELWSAFAWFNAGSLVNWCRDMLFSAEKTGSPGGVDQFDVMFGGLPVGPSEVFVLPHFTGSGTPWLDSGASGAFVGLNLGTTRHDILKGILEGIGYDLILNLAGMEDAGVFVDGIRATGGGTRSGVWNQLKADMTGKTVTVVENPEASALGAAIAAGAASGVFRSIEEGADALVVLGKTYEPNLGAHGVYAERVARYRTLNSAINPLGGRVTAR